MIDRRNHRQAGRRGEKSMPMSNKMKSNKQEGASPSFLSPPSHLPKRLLIARLPSNYYYSYCRTTERTCCEAFQFRKMKPSRNQDINFVFNCNFINNLGSYGSAPKLGYRCRMQSTPFSDKPSLT